MSDEATRKWMWMMDWCKARRLPPASKRVWELAEKAYESKEQKS